MKFGRKLEGSVHPAFRNYYIAYKDLKEAIKVITGEVVVSEDIVGAGSPILELLKRSAISAAEKGGIVRTPESQFQELLDHELSKINNFSNVQFAVMLEEIRELIYKLTHEKADFEIPIENLRQEIVAFDGYLRLNFSGFRKALKKFDKWNKSDSSNWFLQRIVRSDFMLIQTDRLLHGLSVIEALNNEGRYEAINASSTDGIACFANPPMFRRIKYFVAPEDLVEIETEILKAANAVIAYPLTQTVPSSAAQAAEKFTSNRPGAISTGEFAFTESAVIFDNEELQQYVARRTKKSNPGLAGGYPVPVFSVRWNRFQHKEGKCLIVRESHQRLEQGSGLFELEVRQRNVTDLLSGKLNVSGFISSENLRADSAVQEFLTSFVQSATGRNKPVALFSYRRSLFKGEDVMVAVDKDIKFVDLKSLKGGSIFSIPSTQFQAILVQRTVTVWVPRAEATVPAFIEAIAGKPEVSEISGFSKAIHAEAVLHVVTELERPLSVGLPSWFVHTVAGEDNKELRFVSAAAEEELLASPMTSPTSVKFDVLPLAQASSRLLIHDIVAAREPKQVTPAPLPVLPSTTPLVGTELETPLLDRQSTDRARAQTSVSMWDQIKFVLFGSAVPEITEPVSKIEPKTFLANERTFLNWAYLAFILAAVAVTLASVDPTAHLEASLLSLAAVVTLGWSLNIYRLRVIALRNMKALETLMVSSDGATAVCLLVVFALAMTWLGRFRQYLNTLSQ
jgi:SPX domain protein involved in polyphosphate accumulation